MNNSIISSIICNDHICNFTICISNDRNVYSFGKDKYGANGHKNKITFPPKKIKCLSNIKMISCGCCHTICIDYDGNVFSFGLNDKGQLGVGKDKEALNNTYIPQKILLPPIQQVSCGYYYTICLSYDGTLYGFGCNNEGQLGLGHFNRSLSPQLIPDLNNVEFIECGAHHVICKTYNNEFYSWGDNEHNQLGQGNELQQVVHNTPIPCLNWPNNIISIKSGLYHSILLTEKGNIYSFGYNGSGQLGLNNEDIQSVNIPTLVNDIPEIKRIECAHYHTTCIDIDNNIWFCGSNSRGQLGLEIKGLNFKLVKHPTLKNISDVSSGGYHTFVKTSENKIYAFGNNDVSQIGIKTNGNQFTPIQVLEGKEDIWCSFLGKSKQKSARK